MKNNLTWLTPATCCIAVLISVTGCAPQTPREQLTGYWVGVPAVAEEVDQMVDSAAEGQEVNPLARGAAHLLGKALARETMAVTLDLRGGGTAFFAGDTAALGLPADSQGTWEILTVGKDFWEVHFEVDGAKLDAKVVFRDADEFTLRLPSLPGPPRSLAGAVAKQAGSGDAQAKLASSSSANGGASTSKDTPKPRPTSIVFQRVED